MTDTYDATVTLHLSTAATNPDEQRYHRPTRGNQQANNYWYGYTGGTDGWGALLWDHGTARTALVQLDPALTGYTITNVGITVKGGARKDVSASRVSDTSWKIEDTGADVEEGRFEVSVNPPGGGGVLDCDPIWRNK
jgi:hypothetical protein